MPTILARNIRFLRKQKPITQAALAFELKKSQTAVGNWESDYSEPSIEDLGNLTRFFGVSYDDLLGRDLSKGNLIEKDESGEKGNLKGNNSGNLMQETLANEASEDGYGAGHSSKPASTAGKKAIQPLSPEEMANKILQIEADIALLKRRLGSGGE